MRTSA
jgi:DNA replication protein DnaC